MAVRHEVKLTCVFLTFFAFLLLAMPSDRMAQPVRQAPAAARGTAGGSGAAGLSGFAIGEIGAGEMAAIALVAAAVDVRVEAPEENIDSH